LPAPFSKGATLALVLALALAIAGCSLRERRRGPGRPADGQVASTMAASAGRARPAGASPTTAGHRRSSGSTSP